LVLCLLLAVGALGACGDDGRESVDLNEGGRSDLQRRIDDAERRLERLRERDRREGGREPARRTGLAGADKFLSSLEGQAGFTVGPPGAREPRSAGSLSTGAAWSTIKVPIALRVIERAGGPDSLSVPQRAQIDGAITRSDNAAAAKLFASLGATAAAAREVQTVLRASGDDATQVSTQGRDGFSPYGQTDWSLARQHRFMAALAGGCVGDEGDSAYLLDLMGRVTSDTWGLGSAGATARWKGGWGPGTDGRYLVRQMGTLEVGGETLVVTLAAIPSDGQFASGQRIATSVARWVREHATKFAGPGANC
jgi:hypothetical protein